MGRPRGFALLEMTVAILLFSGMLATIFMTYQTGQSAFLTSEANLRATQALRQAVASMEEDLAHARIHSWYQGIGKAYIKFHRMDTSTVTDDNPPFGPDLIYQDSNPLDDTTRAKVLWEDNFEADPQRTRRVYMYVWCAQGGLNSEQCATIFLNNNVPARIGAGVGPVLLVRATDPTNGAGQLSGLWTLERVVAQNVTGLTLDVRQANGAAVPQANITCNTPFPPDEGCIQPFGSPPQLPARVGFEVLTNLRQLGRQARQFSLKGHAQLLNTQ